MARSGRSVHSAEVRACLLTRPPQPLASDRALMATQGGSHYVFLSPFVRATTTLRDVSVHGHNMITWGGVLTLERVHPFANHADAEALKFSVTAYKNGRAGRDESSVRLNFTRGDPFPLGLIGVVADSTCRVLGRGRPFEMRTACLKWIGRVDWGGVSRMAVRRLRRRLNAPTVLSDGTTVSMRGLYLTLTRGEGHVTVRIMQDRGALEFCYVEAMSEDEYDAVTRLFIPALEELFGVSFGWT